MRVRALDSDHDWTFGKGRNDYLSDNRAVVQNINTRLSSFLGDCFFDLGAGIDWFTFLSSKNQAGLALAISSTILNTADVTGINQLTMNLDERNRVFSVSYEVQTVYSRASSVFQFDLNGIN